MGLEVADIFRDHGVAWREANRGYLSLGQLKVMSAIERCRTAALVGLQPTGLIRGGHVMRCENDACGYTAIAYNSCRDRHCPKCQGTAAREWMEARAAELLPVPYFHVVFTLPSPIGDIAYHNKAVIYDLLFRASAETMLTIAADPKHLGARIGITAVLHSWGSAMTHHPHVHMIVPGGGISLDGSQWIAKRPRFLLPVRRFLTIIIFVTVVKKPIAFPSKSRQNIIVNICASFFSVLRRLGGRIRTFTRRSRSANEVNELLRR
jgi:Transposase zinc-binding domain/Putative transposase